jgi:hypothetical protein
VTGGVIATLTREEALQKIIENYSATDLHIESGNLEDAIRAAFLQDDQKENSLMRPA